MPKSNLKILPLSIIGGTGFIGQHLCKELERNASPTIRILSRHAQASTRWPNHFQLVPGNILNLESLNNFIPANSTAINLTYLYDKSDEENIQSARNLAEVCKAKKVKRLIHCSTAVVVGRAKDNIINENTVCIPSTPYEKTKLEIENILIDSLKGKTEVVILRPTAVFGRNGKNLIKVANDLLSMPPLITSLKTALFYKRRLNLVCVENVVSAILFLMQINDRMDGERFIVSDDDEIENNYYDTINLLASNFGHKPVKAFYMPYRYHILRMLLTASKRSNVNAHRNYSSNKLFSLGFEKSIQFCEGVRRFATWYNKSLLHN